MTDIRVVSIMNGMHLLCILNLFYNTVLGYHFRHQVLSQEPDTVSIKPNLLLQLFFVNMSHCLCLFFIQAAVFCVPLLPSNPGFTDSSGSAAFLSHQPPKHQHQCLDTMGDLSFCHQCCSMQTALNQNIVSRRV